MIKVILFDLDGVLVEACEWHYLSLNKALKEVGGFEIGLDDHYARFNGLPTQKKLDILVNDGRIRVADMPAIWDLKQKYTKETILETAKPDEIKISLHNALNSKLISRACVTNSIKETAQLMLETTGQMPYMHKLISNDMVKNPKPHPEGYIRAMVYFGAYPEETLIVEDSPKGLEAAYATGAHVLQVVNCADVTSEKVLAKIKEIE